MDSPRVVLIVGNRYTVFAGRRALATFVPHPAAIVTAADVEWARLYAVEGQ